MCLELGSASGKCRIMGFSTTALFILISPLLLLSLAWERKPNMAALWVEFVAINFHHAMEQQPLHKVLLFWNPTFLDPVPHGLLCPNCCSKLITTPVSRAKVLAFHPLSPCARQLDMIS
mmetsp:Transcript_17198/g.49208  ORF Transcript_17198/g.49208 Transcript_17198/m.49208 type:complete len:119 (+) Transcript_17198:561-917(+)